MSKALARQLELAEVYLDEIGIVGGHNATVARRARDQVAHVRAALESEEVVAEVRGFIGVRIPEEVTRKRWLSFVVHQDQHQHALWPKDIPVTVRIVAVKGER